MGTRISLTPYFFLKRAGKLYFLTKPFKAKYQQKNVLGRFKLFKKILQQRIIHNNFRSPVKKCTFNLEKPPTLIQFSDFGTILFYLFCHAIIIYTVVFCLYNYFLKSICKAYETACLEDIQDSLIKGG